MPRSRARHHVLAFLIASLAALAACGKPRGPSVHGDLAYPTFEIFASARGFQMLARQADTESMSQLLGQAALIDDLLRPAHGSPSTFELRGRESAVLEPEVAREERQLLRILPLVFQRLEHAWDAKTWSNVEVTEAIQALALAEPVEGVPDVAFRLGDDAGNRKSLDELVRWFHALEARPECLAAMLFTIDAGPFVGIPLEGQPLFATEEATETAKKLGKGVELRLAKVEREDEPWALQCVRSGTPVWTTVLSGQPVGRVSSAEIADMDAVDLGPWGWQVVVRVKWTQGDEQHAYVYVDRQGALRFYFLSR